MGSRWRGNAGSHSKNSSDRRADRRSVRFRILVLLLVPLCSLMALWGYAVSLTVQDTLYVNLVAKTEAALHMQTGKVFDALQEERRASTVYLGSGRSPESRDELAKRRQVTDQQVADFNEFVTPDVLDQVNSSERSWLQRTTRTLQGLDGTRKQVDAATMSRPDVMDRYSAVINDCLGIFTMMTTDKNPNFGFYHQTMVALQRARESFSQEDALVAGALATGRFTYADRATFVKLVGAHRGLFSAAEADMTDAGVRGKYHAVTRSRAFRDLRGLEDQVVDGPRTRQLPFDVKRWDADRSMVMNDLREVEHHDYAVLYSHAVPVVTGILVNLGVMALLGVIIAVITIYLSLRVGRSLIRQLIELKETLLELAERRLPRIVDRLRRGEDVDVSAETPELALGSNEIGQVGRAFNLVQRTAVRTAVEQAALQAGVRQVFLNLARRNQALLLRQLDLLDTLERQASGPEELDRLFRIDHLATRMRRHAEDLIVLSGATPRRRWTQPVPMIDVIRGAVEEVENYRRVTVTPIPDVTLIGPAVGDVTHLLAELIENALSFSPPHTHVQVNGESVGSGFAIEIIDRGLGLSAEELTEINARLRTSEEFQLSDDQPLLGLYVVGKLAQRQQINVQLRRSPYGGVTAIVLIPASLIGTAHQAPQSPEPTGGTDPESAESATDTSAAAEPVSPSWLAPTGMLRPRAVDNGTSTAVSDPGEGTAEYPVVGAPPRARRTAPTPGPAKETVPESLDRHDGLTRTGLPKRVRQASLSSQMQDEQDRRPPEPASPQRPEDARALMSAIQRGTGAGRAAVEQAIDGPDNTSGT